MGGGGSKVEAPINVASSGGAAMDARAVDKKEFLEKVYNDGYAKGAADAAAEAATQTQEDAYRGEDERAAAVVKQKLHLGNMGISLPSQGALPCRAEEEQLLTCYNAKEDGPAAAARCAEVIESYKQCAQAVTAKTISVE
jgi:hypothetical protein